MVPKSMRKIVTAELHCITQQNQENLVAFLIFYRKVHQLKLEINTTKHLLILHVTKKSRKFFLLTLKLKVSYFNNSKNRKDSNTLEFKMQTVRKTLKFQDKNNLNLLLHSKEQMPKFLPNN